VNLLDTNEEKSTVINEQKAAFIQLLTNTNREGILSLINYLDTKTDFFTAPASTRFHNNFEGGLLEHSMNVYNNFIKLLELKNIELDEDSIIITALCHDLCKCNYYIKEERNRKVNGKWEQYETWTNNRNPSILLPHSSRSIRILRGFISLKFIEELIIFYHMGPFGGEDYEYRNLMQTANEKYPATLLFYTADLISSYLDEKCVDSE
jgi:hypothetical protein